MSDTRTAEAERMVCAALYVGQGKQIDDVIELLGADGAKFQEAAYRTIYTAMVDLREDGATIDGGTLYLKIKNTDAVSELPSLPSAIATSANILYHAKAVLKSWQLRQIQAAARWLDVESQAGRDPAEIVGDLERLMLETTQGANGAEVIEAKQGAAAGIAYLERLAESGGKVTGIASGIKGIDDITHGFQPNNLIILAARPSVGKTAFALNVAHYATVIQHRPVLFISLEMGIEELWARLFSIAGEVNTEGIKGGFLAKQQLALAKKVKEAMGESTLSVIDQADITIHGIRSAVRTFARKHPNGIVMIDYLQLINGGDAGRKNRYEIVGEQSRLLKGMAKESKIPIMVLAQLGRESEKETDGFKMMKHLRESGNIEQDADLVCILSKPSEDKAKDAGDRGVDLGALVTLTIAKHRNGPIGAVPLNFDKTAQRFADDGGAFQCLDYDTQPITDGGAFDEYVEDEITF